MQERSALERAIAMVEDLRERCSWDRVQTRETLRPYLLEEVHELDQAIADGDSAAIRREVGDLLLHLAWQLVLGMEAGEFTPEEVATELETKMRRRHPHLFELGPREQWEVLKRREGRAGLLDGLPSRLPELLMAQRLGERAAAVGFDWPSFEGPAAKVREELAEVEAAVGGDPAAVEREIGDLLFAVVNLARKLAVAPSSALGRANQRFRARFEDLEQLARRRGIAIETAGLDTLERLWQEVKATGA
jgi:MazG family protein